MALVLNSSAALVTVVLPASAKGMAVKRVALPPGILTNVPDEDWKRCKKVKMVIRLLDDEVLQSGKKAAKTSEKSGVTAALKDMDNGVTNSTDSDTSDEETDTTKNGEEDLM